MIPPNLIVQNRTNGAKMMKVIYFGMQMIVPMRVHLVKSCHDIVIDPK